VQDDRDLLLLVGRVSQLGPVDCESGRVVDPVLDREVVFRCGADAGLVVGALLPEMGCVITFPSNSGSATERASSKPITPVSLDS